MFEDKVLHQKPKNCTPSTLINICKKTNQFFMWKVPSNRWMEQRRCISRGFWHASISKQETNSVMKYERGWASQRVTDSTIARAYVYINGCARECASSINRSAWILRIIDNWRWRIPASLSESQRVAASIYGTAILTLFFPIKGRNCLNTWF